MLLSELLVLGLGSNTPRGEDSCVDLLRKACVQLSRLFTIFEVSSVYRTKPMYMENQERFHNMVVCGIPAPGTSPMELLGEIHRIEASLGRDRSREIRNGPRTLDIDIEMFGTEFVDEPALQIPHPRIRERAFVLVPLDDALSGKFMRLKDSVAKFLGVDFSDIKSGDNDVEFFMDKNSFMMPIKNMLNIVEKKD